MKEQSENKKLEALISERLSAYESEPSKQSRSSIMNAINTPWYQQTRYYWLLLLLVPIGYLSWYLWPDEIKSPTDTANLSNQVPDQASPRVAFVDSLQHYHKDEKEQREDTESQHSKSQELSKTKNSEIAKNSLKQVSQNKPLHSSQQENVALIVPALGKQDEHAAKSSSPGKDFHKMNLLRPISPKQKYFTTAMSKLNAPKLKKSDWKTHKQEVLSTNKKQIKRLGVNIDGLTFITFQRIIPNTTDNNIVESISTPSMLSPERLGFRLSGNISWRLNDHFDLVGGVAAYNQRIVNEILISGTGEGTFDLDTKSNSYEVTPQSETISIDERIWSIGAQFGFRYYLPQSNRNFWLGTMVDFQSAFDNLLTDSFYISEKQTYLNVELGWKTEITDCLEFQINPNLSYSLLSNQKQNAVFRIHPFSFGLNFGLRYKIW